MSCTPCFSASWAHSFSTLKPIRLPAKAGLFPALHHTPKPVGEQCRHLGEERAVGVGPGDDLGAYDQVGRVEEVNAQEVPAEVRASCLGHAGDGQPADTVATTVPGLAPGSTCS